MSERRTLDSALAGSTLTGAESSIDYRPVAVMPEVRVVKIGGQSIMDRGRTALFPILDEVIEARKKGIQVVLLAGGLAYAHLLPSPPVGTVVWWLWRIPWLIMLAVVLAVLVAIFSPIESRRLRRPEAPPRWLPLPVERALVRPVPYLLLTVAGILAAAAGLWLNNVASRFGHDLLGIPTGALALYLAGALVLRLLRAIPEPRR